MARHPIGLDDFNRFEIDDEDNSLYWDGKRIKATPKIPTPIKAVIIAGVFTVLGALIVSGMNLYLYLQNKKPAAATSSTQPLEIPKPSSNGVK